MILNPPHSYDHTSSPLNISLPYNFTPRTYQEQDLFRQLFPHHYPDLVMLATPRKDRICMVHHRRAGKDKSLINAITLAAYEDVGNYLYLLPEQTQAKKIIWRGIDADGFKFLDHIPKALAKNFYSSELLVELVNGSTIQIGGSDNYDSWMGTNPKGIVFSEYSLQDPMAWQYFRPILAENGGWAVFNYTARGKNHGYELLKVAKESPDRWHWSVRTIDDTRKHDGSPVITREQYLQEIKDGMPEAIARQEFYCDFEAALVGSYYGDLLAKAEAESPSRIGFYPHDPTRLVFTGWDIGLDATAVWFAQDVNGNPHIIDYFEESNTRFSECCTAIVNRKYTYGTHFGPHDLVNRDPEMNRRLDTASSLGINLVVTPRCSVSDGIEAVRNLIPRTRFHKSDNTERGLDALRSYERKYDERLQRFRDAPIHNWASHGSDAFRILALNWQEGMTDDSWFTQKIKIDTRGFI
jgi:hypothetical protein